MDLLRGIIIAGIFIAFSFGNFSFFESLERFFYGIEMRFSISPSLGENRIAIVNIDKKSLKHLGPWPWPRHIIAEMIAILKDNGARLIGLDLAFNENEQNRGLQEVRALSKAIQEQDRKAIKDPWLLNTLKEIEERLDHDKALVRVVKECGNVILPVSGRFGKYDTELVLTRDSYLNKNRIDPARVKSGLEGFVSVSELVSPFPELSKSSHGLGHIDLSPNESMKGRNHLLFFDFRGHIIPSMPLRLAIEYPEQQGELTIQSNGIHLKGHYIPASKGDILIKFKGGRRSFPYYSFIDILKVKKVPAVFEDKIVLLGYTAEGGATVNTPVDMDMPRVEFIANIIEGLLNGRYLKRPAVMTIIEAFLLLIIIMACSFILPRATVLNRVAITGGVILLILLTGIISFVAMDTWFKTVYIGFALIILYFEIMIRDIILSQRKMGLSSKEAIESNRMLGLSFQSQGLLDLAFERFRKCPLDDSMKDVVYNLGLDYERKRMINKAIAVYEYIIETDGKFRDLRKRVEKLRKVIGGIAVSAAPGKKEEKIVVVDDLEIKPTVGRYEIVKELGQGAMGIVYEAMDPKINRRLAIKTIRFSDEFEEKRVKEVKERFLKEAEIAGQLSHPSIVSIYDVGEDYDLTYLAMEFLTGSDLVQYCEKGSLLPLKKVLQVVNETADALDYAHNNGVIHRDVKPANIMLLKNGKISVTDFGIAKAVSSSQTKSGVVLGTPNYMSPEQINGQQIDGRSDIFALGVVLFELLTGQVPFRGKNMTNLLYNITQARHPSVREINPKVPKACEQIIDKALAKSPDKRFQRAGEFANYLKAIIKKIDQVGARTG